MCSAKRMWYFAAIWHIETNIIYSVSTLRAAMELKNVFEQIQAAEKAGNLTPEEKRRLEEQAAEKGLQALFKVRSSIFCTFVRLIGLLIGHETRDRVCASRNLRPDPRGPKRSASAGSATCCCSADSWRCLYERT